MEYNCQANRKICKLRLNNRAVEFTLKAKNKK